MYVRASTVTLFKTSLLWNANTCLPLLKPLKMSFWTQRMHASVISHWNRTWKSNCNSYNRSLIPPKIKRWIAVGQLTLDAIPRGLKSLLGSLLVTLFTYRYIDPSPFVDSLGLDTAQQQVIYQKQLKHRSHSFKLWSATGISVSDTTVNLANTRLEMAPILLSCGL